MFGFRSRYARSVQTTIPCDKCQKPLTAQRGWREVMLRCTACGASFPVSQFSQRMDEALEDFLESVYCDRM